VTQPHSVSQTQAATVHTAYSGVLSVHDQH
jgi:hypothetical protein